MRVKDGETIYIGGLIQTDHFKISRKVPFLGDIPILGEPFKSRYTRINDTELIIFVTPHIVKKRDAELITRQGTSMRDYMLQTALDKGADTVAKNNTSKKKDEELPTPRNSAIKNKEANVSSKKAVQIRDNKVKDAIEKYSVEKQ